MAVGGEWDEVREMLGKLEAGYPKLQPRVSATRAAIEALDSGQGVDLNGVRKGMSLQALRLDFLGAKAYTTIFWEENLEFSMCLWVSGDVTERRRVALADLPDAVADFLALAQATLSIRPEDQ
mgnify:CR=1 FL=1